MSTGCGSGPSASAHGSTDFIKRRSLATGSTTWIKPSESVSRLIISAVHHRSDGWDGWLRPRAARAHALSGTSRPSVVARWSLSFLELRWLVFNEVFSFGITATRGTCLCYPWSVESGNGDQQWWGGSASAWRWWGQPPVKLWLQGRVPTLPRARF
jgi:hypothetical protein